jgi:hypothetical protein
LFKAVIDGIIVRKFKLCISRENGILGTYLEALLTTAKQYLDKLAS